MNFIIGQIISVAALIIAVVIAQFKDVKHILIGEIVSNLSVALSYVFLGGMSGAWICIVAAVQTLIIYYANKHNLEQKKRNILTAVFAAAYVIGTIIVYQGWGDIVSCACALLYVMAIIQTDTAKYRWFMAANSFMWIIYDFTTLAFVNVITHGSVLISVIIAKIRLDWRKQPQ